MWYHLEIKLQLDDSTLANFSEDAKKTLRLELTKYSVYLVSEANNYEATERQPHAEAEVTSNIVVLVTKSINKHKIVKKKNIWILAILKIVATLSTLFAGLLFDGKGFTDNLIIHVAFIVMLIIMCVSVMLDFILSYKE